MKRILWNLLREEDGATAVEYAVMLALIIAVCMVSIRLVGEKTNDLYSDNNDKLQDAFSSVN